MAHSLSFLFMTENLSLKSFSRADWERMLIDSSLVEQMDFINAMRKSDLLLEYSNTYLKIPLSDILLHVKTVRVGCSG